MNEEMKMEIIYLYFLNQYKVQKLFEEPPYNTISRISMYSDVDSSPCINDGNIC